jgi:predicted transport protein
VTQVAIDETWSALRFKPVPGGSDQDLVSAQFAGAKAALRPIYDLVLGIILGFGEDVKVNPRQSYIALARKVQFAALKASTSTRLDLGLRLKAAAMSDRLEAAQGVGGGSINFKVSLSKIEDVDTELIAWLRQAYEGAG